MSTSPVPGVSASLERLRALCGKGRLSAEEIERKVAAYVAELVNTDADPRDVAAGVDVWLGMQPDAFPDSWPLFRAAVEEARFKRVAAEAETALVEAGSPGVAGENFVQRALRLGFHAGRLSVVGYHRYEDLARWHAWGWLDDVELRRALEWLERNPGERLARGFADRIRRGVPDTVESARGVWSDCKRLATDPASVGGTETARLLLDVGLFRLGRAAEAGRIPADAIAKLPSPVWERTVPAGGTP